MPSSGVFEIAANAVPEHAPVCPLDLNGVLDKQTIFQSLVTTFNFPDYFGYNWDATYDCLLDSVAQADNQTDIYFSVHENSLVTEQDFLTFFQLLQDVCNHQQQKQKSIRFFIISAKLKGDASL
ncbi:MAG: barstar family protein [Methylophaga sp.]|nr:barstar family protein [Methylophaga sp.]